MHTLILGMTESGKTTIAKLLAAELRKQKQTVMVLDPIHDEWDCDFQTSDPNEFLEAVKACKECFLFIDEGGTSIGRYNAEMEWLATQSRHLGHSCFFISQRAVQMAASIRHQCSVTFLFAVGVNDMKLLAEEWSKPRLANEPQLSQGEFLIIERFSEIKRGRVDFPSQSVIMLDGEKSIKETENVEDSQSEEGSDSDSVSSGDADDASNRVSGDQRELHADS